MRDPVLSMRDAVVEQQVNDATNGARIGFPCYGFQALDSTMDLAHELAGRGEEEGACVWSETQKQGRGRGAHSWVSPPGGIYCSLILRPTRPVSDLPQLALITGLAVAQAIRELTQLSATIRWPNDVLLQDRKVAGILAEATSSSGGQPAAAPAEGQPVSGTDSYYAVVGIGINVTTSPEELPEGATSIGQVVQTPPDRFVLAGELFRQFETFYQRWNAGGFTVVRPSLTRWIGIFGKLVRITTGAGQFEGQATDLDDSGRLLVRLDSGLVRPFDAGEVTLLR